MASISYFLFRNQKRELVRFTPANGSLTDAIKDFLSTAEEERALSGAQSQEHTVSPILNTIRGRLREFGYQAIHPVIRRGAITLLVFSFDESSGKKAFWFNSLPPTFEARCLMEFWIGDICHYIFCADALQMLGVLDKLKLNRLVLEMKEDAQAGK